MRAFWALFRFSLRRQLVCDLVFAGTLVGLLVANMKNVAMYICFLHSFAIGLFQKHGGIKTWDATLMTMPVSPEALLGSRYGMILLWTLLRASLYCTIVPLMGLELTLGEPVLLLCMGVALGHLLCTNDHPAASRTIRGEKFWGWAFTASIVYHISPVVNTANALSFWVVLIYLVVFTLCLGFSWKNDIKRLKLRDW